MSETTSGPQRQRGCQKKKKKKKYLVIIFQSKVVSDSWCSTPTVVGVVEAVKRRWTFGPEGKGSDGHTLIIRSTWP